MILWLGVGCGKAQWGGGWQNWGQRCGSEAQPSISMHPTSLTELHFPPIMHPLPTTKGSQYLKYRMGGGRGYGALSGF